MAPTILLVDDSRLARLKIETVLRGCGVCFDFAHADDGAAGAAMLTDRRFDLVLCDVLMPKVDGLGFLRLKASDPSHEEVPVIMLTSREEIEIKLQCLEAGASDYLLKPFHDQELVARVRIHLELKELQDKLRAKNESLERLIRVDALTGVANRLHLSECLRQELSRGRRHGLPFALAILDVDRFKSVNDRFGHLAGDQVLRELAIRLYRAVRAHDLVARFGGEEFALLLPQTGPEDAPLVVERCRRRVSESPFTAGEESFRLTASAGIGSYPEGGAETEDELLRQADEALYEAKSAGRDRLVSWQPPAA